MQRSNAGTVVIVLTIAATQAVAWIMRTKVTIIVAGLSVPFQVWFYLSYAIPTAALTPN